MSETANVIHVAHREPEGFAELDVRCVQLVRGQVDVRVTYSSSARSWSTREQLSIVDLAQRLARAFPNEPR